MDDVKALLIKEKQARVAWLEEQITIAHNRAEECCQSEKAFQDELVMAKQIVKWLEDEKV